MHVDIQIAFISAVAAVFAGCRDPNAVRFPDDGVVTLVLPAGKTIAPLDTTTLYASVQYQSEDPAGKDWDVVFSVERGTMGPDHAIVKRLRTDKNGTVHVAFFAPKDTGWVHVTVRGGDSKSVDSLMVVSK